MQPIRTALLSFGMSGRLFHAPFLNWHPGFTLHTVWERTTAHAATFYPAVKSVRQLDDLLTDDTIELVVVNTPNATHADYARQALLAGKHVVVEKPFVVTVAEGEALVQLAAETGRILSVYQNRRYDSDYRTVRRILLEGVLGPLAEAEFRFDRYRVDLSTKAHKEAPTPGNGALYDLGSHLVDQALQLFGKPESLYADIRTVRPASVVDDYFEILLYYPTLRVRLRSSYLVREGVAGYQLYGQAGSFLKAKTNVQEDALNRGEQPGSEGWGTEPEAEHGLLHTEYDGLVRRERVQSERGHYGDYFTALHNAIRYGGPIPVPAAEGLAVVALIEAAFESNRLGKRIALV